MLKLQYSKLLEAGTDEAGRGCLAGPVTAATVILPSDFSSDALDDSKTLSKSQREKLRPLIEEQAICYAVASVSHVEIDRINILQAALKAMHMALDQLNPTPLFIAVDGNKFNPYKSIPHQTLVKGDSRFLNIAAASVLAKTYRDGIMEKLHQEYPVYNWKQNKGYPTREHRNAIRQYGLSPYHRKSFKQL